jgi:hypothetical protein
MEKKPYNPPAITTQGNVVDQTKGFGGIYYEAWNPRPTSPIQEWDD